MFATGLGFCLPSLLCFLCACRQLRTAQQPCRIPDRIGPNRTYDRPPKPVAALNGNQIAGPTPDASFHEASPNPEGTTHVNKQHALETKGSNHANNMKPLACMFIFAWFCVLFRACACFLHAFWRWAQICARARNLVAVPNVLQL